ncbi:hypothetical protein CVT25_015010 [Psilocybe cyanescens]|uniref:Uncharacterized protein n=1 Tax=Psilocybe cyanescens TaxID=93625 RepID=A0A409XAR2_PSICY|nr:hypothetical protein CVT25_015010 [Psilocybe cyanescens]
MSQNNIIRPFNPFSLQHGTDDDWNRDVLTSIVYGESRLRTALGKMIEADSRHQGWMQTCLLKEIRFFMQYVSIATALGLVFDTPIVLRSLAASLCKVDTSHLPIPYDARLIAILSAGTHSEQPYRTVPRYKYDWWNKHLASATLDNKKLHASLEFHDKQLQSAQPTTELPDDEARFRLPSTTLPPVPRINLLSAPKFFIPVADADAGCTMCNTYQQMAIDLYQMNVDAVRNTQQLLSLAETESLLCERRVAGFYEVHEAALLKETANVPTTGTESGLAPALLPPDRSQWTWGESLTREDVLALGRSQQREIHTGYGIELEDGNIAGSDSEMRNTVGSRVQQNGSPHSAIQVQWSVEEALRNMSDDDPVESMPAPVPMPGTHWTNLHSPACGAIATISDHTNVAILPPRSLPQGSIHVQAALSNISDDSEVEIVLPTSVHRGGDRIRDVLANMSDDDEV